MGWQQRRKDHARRDSRVDRFLILQRIFLLSLCLGDRRSWDRPMFNSFMLYTAYARVCALRVQGCAEHKHAIMIADRIFRDFFFIGLFGNISQPGTQTDARRGQFKKDLNNCAVIRPAFSSLFSRYSFSKTRKLSSSIRRSSAL